MKLVRQKNKHDCGLASLFMLNDNKDYRRIKKFCKRYLGYNPNKGIGIYIDWEKICDQLKLLNIDAYLAPKPSKTIAGHTRYNRAMILCFNDESGHCVAWNGYCCYDPDEEKTYSEYSINQKLNYEYCSIIVFKTPLYERVFSFIKKPFYEMVH